MQLEQTRWHPTRGWQGPAMQPGAQLVLMFGETGVLGTPGAVEAVRARYPGAVLLGGSTAGSIAGRQLTDHELVVTAVLLEKGSVRLAVQPVAADAYELGTALMTQLAAPDLRFVFALSDGLAVNGSALARGLMAAAPAEVVITGGLAGDGARFERTYLVADGAPASHQVAAVGFYGADLRVGTGCFAGWQEFGPERVITRSLDNVVYAIDGQPALELYKRYLGEQADGLPGSGLRFPLSVREASMGTPTIRTLLAVDEAAQSLTFAGDVPEGQYCRLMKTDLDALIEHAGMAARSARMEGDRPALGLVVSCVGRRLVLEQLVEEELEIVGDTLGPQTVVTGFYSYGELAPTDGDIRDCRLHNQTMTLALVSEA